MPGFKDVKVVRANLGHNSGLIGSAALAFLAQENGRPDITSKLIHRSYKG